ncbi:MAG: RrF2 family transcriptional regulator [Rhizobiaceae bacterium]
MRLNQASDFALRILMLMAIENKPMTVEEIAKHLKLVKSHVMKIVAKLVRAGVLRSIRGRSGGVVLARNPHDITVGMVVREIEVSFPIVECMADKETNCVFAPNCRLQGVMANARSAFMKVLDDVNIGSLVNSGVGVG